MSDELERIGRLMLYRNKILEKLLREISKDFPNMEIVLEEFERLLEAIDDLDNETIHTIAKLKEKGSVIKQLEDVEEELGEDFEDWLANVLNSLNGNDSLKNYVTVLNQMGGVAPTTKMSKVLGLKKSTISEIEKELESKGIIKSFFVADRKVVYLNHPKYHGMTIRELTDAISGASEFAKRFGEHDSEI